MERKTARLSLIAGIIVLGIGVLAYTAYISRMETRHDTAAKSLQQAQPVDNQPAPADEKQTAAKLPAEEKSKTTDSEPGLKKAEKKPEQDSEDSEGELIDAARKALDTPDVAVRVQMARKLRNEKSEEAVEILYTFLNDESKAVISAALSSLAYIGNDGPLENKVYNILLEKASDKDFYERGQALIIASLFDRDETVLPLVAQYISGDDENETGKRYAVKALAAIADPACVEHLKKILDETKSPEVQKQALYTLARLESDDALDLLQKNLYVTDSQTQLDTAWALSQQNKQEYNQMLSDAMSSRKLNEEALAMISRNPAGPPLLEEVLNSDEFNKKEKLSMLKIYADNMTLTTNTVRSGIVTAVQPLLESQDADLQIEAIRIMGLGFGDETTEEILKPKLQASESSVRKEALNAYTSYLSPYNYKPVLDMIWDEDQAIRRKALMLATEYIDETDRQYLEKALKHDDEVIREQVQQLLN